MREGKQKRKVREHNGFMDNRTVLAVVNDLFFSVKITEAAKRAGVAVQYVTKEQDVLEKAGANPSLIIFDLDNASAGPVELIARLKGDESKRHIPLLGYLKHVHTDLQQQALAAGCDQVMPRSAFSMNLNQIFALNG
jgi:CheY-like chemotaxis protein